MKRFIIRLTLFFSGLLGAVAIGYSFYAQQYPLAKNYFTTVTDKEQILATNSAPRLIATGGSSVAFGIDAELIAKRLGLRPANMGVHIGFGLSFLLAQLEAHMGEGDVVLLGPEYDMFTKYLHGEPEVMATIFEWNPHLLTRMSGSEAKQLSDRGYLLRVGRVLRTVAARGDPPLELSDQIYYRGAFNQHGDLVSYLGQRGSGASTMNFVYQRGAANAAIARLNDFHRLCQKRGVKVFLAHPPYGKRYYDEDVEAINQLESELTARLTIPMLDTPVSATVEEGLLFDTSYHLNPVGRKAHSERLAELLVRRLSSVTAEREK